MLMSIQNFMLSFFFFYNLGVMFLSFYTCFKYRGVLLIWIRVGQGPTALAVSAGGGCLDIFSLFLLPLSRRRSYID